MRRSGLAYRAWSEVEVKTYEGDYVIVTIAWAVLESRLEAERTVEEKQKQNTYKSKVYNYD